MAARRIALPREPVRPDGRTARARQGLPPSGLAKGDWPWLLGAIFVGGVLGHRQQPHPARLCLGRAVHSRRKRQRGGFGQRRAAVRAERAPASRPDPGVAAPHRASQARTRFPMGRRRTACARAPARGVGAQASSLPGHPPPPFASSAPGAEESRVLSAFLAGSLDVCGTSQPGHQRTQGGLSATGRSMRHRWPSRRGSDSARIDMRCPTSH